MSSSSSAARIEMSSAFGYQKGGDLEAGSSGAAGQQRALYPGMQESPELRWALIRKIYVILSLQLLLTAAVAAVVVVPDDSAALVAAQAVVAAVLAAGAAGLFVGSVVLAGLQESD